MKRFIHFLSLLAISHAMASIEYSASLEQKARSGDHQAQMELAIAYEQGKGIPKDERKAMEWFQKARQGGYPDQELAQLNQQRVALASSRIEIAVQTYRTQNGDRLTYVSSRTFLLWNFDRSTQRSVGAGDCLYSLTRWQNILPLFGGS